MTEIFTRKKHRERRKQLRHNMPKAEAVLWKYLNRKQIHGYRFLRQFSISSYILDFYCPKLRLAVEIDGGTHISDEAVEYDRIRQSEIESLGIQFVRFSNEEVLFGLYNVLESIKKKINEISMNRK